MASTQRLPPGSMAPAVVLPAIDGTTFDTASLAGQRWMLGFFRFAGCPFCNFRLHELVTHYQQFGSSFSVVAVFDSPLDNLIAHAARHRAPFPILADETGACYRSYRIERSLLGVAKGITLRMPTLIRATLMGYIPRRVRGSMTTMPADFLINEDGTIAHAWYGRDEGDHMPLDRIIEFAGHGTAHGKM